MCAVINSLLPLGESESKHRVGAAVCPSQPLLMVTDCLFQRVTESLQSSAAEMKLLLVLMSSLSLVDAVIGSDKPVTVTVGDNAILPCHLEPPFNVTNLTVEWKRGATIVHICTNGEDYLTDQDENFTDRTSLFHEEMIRGNISLKLTNVTELDAGSYTCNVPKLQSQVRRGFINLTVEPVEQKKDKRSPTHNNNRQPENVGDDTAAIIGVAVVIIAGTVISFVVVLWGLCRNTRQEDNVWANVGSNVISNVWANVGANVGSNAGSNVGASDGANDGANDGASDERMSMLNINTRQEDNPEANVGSSDGASKDNTEDDDVETKL